jgi:hypothetical protein
MPGYTAVGRRATGESKYPADPPTVEEIIAVTRTIGDGADGHRLRGFASPPAAALQGIDSSEIY